MLKSLCEVYTYREMVVMLVNRELRGRYKGSFLGFLWTFLNPLLQLAVYTLVFSVIMKSGIDKYYLFLFVALIPWIFFSSSILGGANCIIAQKDLVKKIYFPRQVLPIAHVTTCFINMLLCFIVVFIVAGFSIGINLIALPYLVPILFVEYILALGFALFAAAITVYFRDMEHILAIVVMAWQFMSPVIYSADIVPDSFKSIFMANPMTSVIIAYRSILYYKVPPDLTTLLMALLMGTLFLIIGWVVFNRLQKHFVEEM